MWNFAYTLTYIVNFNSLGSTLFGMTSTWPGTMGLRLTIASEREVSKNICDGFKRKGPKKKDGLIIIQTLIIIIGFIFMHE